MDPHLVRHHLHLEVEFKLLGKKVIQVLLMIEDLVCTINVENFQKKVTKNLVALQVTVHKRVLL